MGVQAQREAGRVLFWGGAVAMVLWWATVAIYCSATHTWDRPLNQGPFVFGVGLGSWTVCMGGGAAWWLYAAATTKRAPRPERTCYALRAGGRQLQIVHSAFDGGVEATVDRMDFDPSDDEDRAMALATMEDRLDGYRDVERRAREISG